MLISFMLSVIVQYNDPDPLGWMLIYGLASLTCMLFIIQKLHWIVPACIALASLIWATTLLPYLLEHSQEISWNQVFGYIEMKSQTIEITREVGGLLIVFSWMSVLGVLVYLTSIRKK